MMYSRLICAAGAIAMGAICVSRAATAGPLPSPVYSWTGFYVGAHAGGVLFDAGYQNLVAADRHAIGGLGGGQIGVNYQTGMIVVGIEAEGFWSGMKVVNDQFFNSNTLFATASIRNKWDVDVAGRFGVAFDRALVYGKAGWVFGGFDWNYSDRFGYSNRAGATLDGLLIGIGLEYAFSGNWTAKFEYDYLGFGARNVHFTEACTGVGCFIPPNGFTQSVSADKHIFKLGFNYKVN